MSTMSYTPPPWVLQAAADEARAVRRRRVLILGAVLITVILVGL